MVKRVRPLYDVNKDVLLVGTYSSLNKGDRLMQQVVAQQLSKVSGDISVTLAAPFPEIDANNYSNLSVVKSRRRNLPVSFAKLFFLLLLPPVLRKKYAWRDTELSQFMRASLIVDTSGDMLTEDYGVIVAVSHLFPLVFSVLLGKKLVILAQSVGPFNYLKSLFIKVFSKAVVVTLRDQISYDYLKGLGLDNIESVSDLGFLMNSEANDYPVGGDKNEGQLVIGFCPSSLLLKKFSGQLQGDSVEQMCARLKEFSETFDCVFELIPHVMTPSGKLDDDVLCADMASLIGANCRVLPADFSPAEIKYAVSQMDALVSFRMHGAIAGLDSDIPTIAVSYSHKTIGLFEKLGLQEWVVSNDLNMLDELFTKLPLLLDRRATISAQLESVLPDIRKSAYRNIEILKREVCV